MPFFSYKAKNTQGVIQKGKVEASTLDLAVQTLQERGFFVINVKPLVESKFKQLDQQLNQMQFNDVVLFTRQLASMIEAGLALTNSIALLKAQSKPSVGAILDQINSDLEGGMSFSKALEKHPKTFSPTYVHLVQAGESSGSLDKILARLADTMEEQREFKGKIKSALVYPIIVFLVMIVVAIIMIVSVIPKLLEVFTEFGADLPLPTRILMSISNFVTGYWWLILLVLGLLVIVFLNWYKSPAAKRTVDNFLFGLPIVGELRKKTILTEYTQTLGMLIRAGVPVVESLTLAKEGVSSFIYREDLTTISKDVERGIGFGEGLARYEEFPLIMPQMIKVGEETGKLDDMLFRLSQYFKTESERAVASLVAAFEPIIMIILGLAVAFLVIAVILPIYDLTNQITV